MTLATVSTTGTPHAAAIYFAAAEKQSPNRYTHLFFFSNFTSQHGQDLASNPHAAAEIHPEVPDWQNIHGLQLHGLVKPVEAGPNWEEAWRVYRAKFPFTTGLKDLISQNWLYAFSIHWIRLIDNRQGFGFKMEWSIP